jgi:hypothetical protein
MRLGDKIQLEKEDDVIKIQLFVFKVAATDGSYWQNLFQERMNGFICIVLDLGIVDIAEEQFSLVAHRSGHTLGRCIERAALVGLFIHHRVNIALRPRFESMVFSKQPHKKERCLEDHLLI